MHKKGCGFFTEMYGNMSDLYLRIDNKGDIIVIEGAIRDSVAPGRKNNMKNIMEHFRGGRSI